MQETTESTRKRLIEAIDRDLESVLRERAEISSLSPSLVTRFEDLHAQISESFTRLLKRVALEQNQDVDSLLQDALDELTRRRAHLLIEAARSATERVDRTITSPLWIGERSAYTRGVQSLRRTLQEIESLEPKNIIRRVGVTLEEVASLNNQVAIDERRSRVRLPFQVLVWGLPIVVGIWVSGKLTTSQNAIAFSVVVGMAVLSYGLLRFSLLWQIKPARWVRRLLALERHRAMVLLQIPLILTVVSFSLLEPLDRHIIRSRLEVEVGPVPSSIARGSELNVPFRVKYLHPRPVVAVQVVFEAPGIAKEEKEEWFNALGQLAETGDFSVAIPGDIPSGRYSLDLEVSFIADRWLFWGRKRASYSVQDTVDILIE